jgi:hypothetical protein
VSWNDMWYFPQRGRCRVRGRRQARQFLRL